MELRPYQQAAVDALFGWWNAGRQGEDPLISLPTASGKTIIFSALIKRLMADYPGVSVLILAHRKELIVQAEDKLKTVWPGAPVGVYAAGIGRREIAPITIASRDTVAGVIDEIGQFTFVIVDEAHRMNTKDEGRYRKIIEALRAKYDHLVVIGFTATPFRLGQGQIYGDGKPFADLAYRAGMIDLIKDGYLAPLTSAAPTAGEIDTEGVRTTAGDFNEADLEARATSAGIVETALGEWRETALDAGRAHSVFFCVSILHAGMVSEKLAHMGINAPVVTGETPAKERDKLLEEFNAGKYVAIINVGVLTEGWDCPRVDCIVLMRPTKSASLYVQMVGRGLRPSPDTKKRDCLILDFGGNIERLGPVDQADEPEPKKRKKRAGAEAKPYKRCGEWDPDNICWNNGCGQKNATAATECCKCGQPFVRHDTAAARGGIVSTERAYENFDVERIDSRVATSQRSGKTYLRIAYTCGLFEVFYKNLMIGYSGYAGERALKEWWSITTIKTSPDSPDEARWMIESGETAFKPVDAITVDLASRWKDIILIHYSDQEAA